MKTRSEVILANEQAAHIVYIIRMGDTDYYKVGVTKDMHSLGKRRTDLQAGNPFPLTIAYTVEFEKDGQAFNAEQATHKAFLFANYGLGNKEWGQYRHIESVYMFLLSQEGVI